MTKTDRAQLRRLLAVLAAVDVAGPSSMKPKNDTGPANGKRRVWMQGWLWPLRRPFDLYRANLSGQFLAYVYLANADLRKANLSGADAYHADLDGAVLTDPKLNGVNLNMAPLNYAILVRTNLSDANLSSAILNQAHLDDANLSGADLRGAFLVGAKLNGIDLSQTLLSDQEQLDGACGTGTKLPIGLKLKPCPPVVGVTPWFNRMTTP